MCRFKIKTAKMHLQSTCLEGCPSLLKTICLPVCWDVWRTVHGVSGGLTAALATCRVFLTWCKFIAVLLDDRWNAIDVGAVSGAGVVLVDRRVAVLVKFIVALNDRVSTSCNTGVVSVAVMVFVDVNVVALTVWEFLEVSCSVVTTCGCDVLAVGS